MPDGIQTISPLGEDRSAGSIRWQWRQEGTD